MRRSGPDGHSGTTPPVPGWPTFLLLLGLPALLFALFTWQVVAHGPLARADERLSGHLVSPARIYELLADLGGIAVAVPVLAVVLVYVALRGRRAGLDRWWLPSVAAAVLMAVVPALVVPVKELVARPGPPVMGPGTGFYPSGHTATAAVAYGAATLVLLPWLRTALARRALVAGCLVLNLAVPFGLVRRGFHWPLDVVASWCLCAVLLSALWMLLGRTGPVDTGRPSGPAADAQPK
ncbi:phosphatase PAP2 family protein [Streptomyces sp. NPDC127072]|uniref:phosphatase PAP2 family protein n=1 Tax=Streptomyces sp. NPDC127072 TaxID=3347129 RepID=UPI0036511C92